MAPVSLARYDVGMPRWQHIFLAITALLLAGALLVVAVPATIVNTATLKYALRRFGGDYRPSASELSLRVTSAGLFTKRVVLEARDLCVDEFHGAAKGCLPILKLDAVVRLGAGAPVSVRHLERLVVLAGELNFDSTKVLPSKRAPGLFPAWAAGMSLGTVDVRIPKAVLTSSTSITTAGLSASFFSLSTAPLTAELYAVVKGTDSGPGRRWDAELTLDSDLFRRGRLTSLDAAARARAEGGFSAAAAAKLEKSDETVRGTFDAFAANAQGGFRLAALEGCRIEAPDADCRVKLQPAPSGPGDGPKPKALTGAASLRDGKAVIRIDPSPGYGGFTAALDRKSAASAIAAFLRWFEDPRAARR